MSVLGKRLKFLREKFVYSQKRVADSIGISNTQLSRYESGDRNPDPELIAKFADFYDVTTDYLHGRTDDPEGFFVEQENMEYDPLAVIKDYIEKKGGLDQFGFFNIDEWKDLTPEQVEGILQDFDYMFQRAKKMNEEKK
jgi:HTH-type transcriptional regulator, competence development regulator